MAERIGIGGRGNSMTRHFESHGIGADPEVIETVDRLAGVAAEIARRIARGGIEEDLAAQRGTNTDGDTQKALDVIADEAFATALQGGNVRFYASEERDDITEIAPNGTLAVAIDPLDGSSNIDTNVSVGSIFAIYRARNSTEASVLRPGREMVAGGYAIYGPQCCLVVSFGAGVLKFVLDPESGLFRAAGTLGPIPADSTEYAINASNYRHWPTPVRAYIDDRLAGAEGPMGRNFNMRWIASLVAETHRILTRGGIFLYPGDDRKGYRRGRLRMVYECAPIGFLIEQAGGAATDSVSPILDQTPDSLHARTPFVFGSRHKVARLREYFEQSEQESGQGAHPGGLFPD